MKTKKDYTKAIIWLLLTIVTATIWGSIYLFWIR